MSLVATIAPSCAWVAERARHVTLHRDKIAEYARFITGKYPVTTQMDDNHFVGGDLETRAAYILALDSINFGSGYFTLARQYGVELEYHVIAGGLKKWFERGDFVSAEDWARVTVEDFSRLLALPIGLHADLDGLLAAFQRHLREAGKKILAGYGGEVLSLLDSCGRSAIRLADTVAGWKGFHDVHAYQGREIPILKRAQILAADMNLALGGFSGIDRLTIFADNMVPHVLRCDGLLDYTSDDPVVSGSEKEIEIRALAIHAVELMKESVSGFSAVNLDHMLWHRGYEPDLYARKPHRTMSVWY